MRDPATRRLSGLRCQAAVGLRPARYSSTTELAYTAPTTSQSPRPPLTPEERAATKKWPDIWAETGPLLDAERWNRLLGMSDEEIDRDVLLVLALWQPEWTGDAGDELLRHQALSHGRETVNVPDTPPLLAATGHRACLIGSIAVQPRATQDVHISVLAHYGDEAGVITTLTAAFETRVSDAGQFALDIDAYCSSGHLLTSASTSPSPLTHSRRRGSRERGPGDQQRTSTFASARPST